MDERTPAESILAHALGLSENERETYVASATVGNLVLREEVLSLLAHCAADDPFLETPLLRPRDGPAELDSPPDLAEAADVGNGYGQYRVLRKLGEGGMGVVYLAEQLRPVARRVALKVVKLGMDTRQVVTRFRREQQALALMNHPGVAQVFDAGATPDGRPYFVMEYVDGVRITDFCETNRLSIVERLRLFVRLGDAVRHAHQKGIIHRDLKPSNILVIPGPTAQPKIIDFGIAKATQFVAGTLHTDHGMLVGTPDYMSPEQADPSGRSVDTRSDIYSLGVVLHELLLGSLPRGVTPGRATGVFGLPQDSGIRCAPSQCLSDPTTPADRFAEERSTDRRGLVRQVAGDLDAILLKTLHRDVDQRYSTVAELAADVGRYLDNEPVLASTPTVIYRARKLVAKNRSFFVAVAMIFLLLAVGSVVSTSLYLVNKQQRDRIFRLSDRILLEDVVGEADSLWPARPDKAAAMEAWLAGNAGDLRQRLPVYQAWLAEMEARVGSTGGEDERLEAEFELRLLRDLTRELEAFGAPEVGLYAQVEARLAFARSIRRLSLEDHATQWQGALAAIADRTRCPMYGGLSMPPQLGLVPLGPDPVSGLWEFAHLETGEVPVRDEAGRIVITENTGLVFVLIPGGSFRMGAQRADASHPSGHPNVDPLARRNEGPVHQVRISEPFFLSKYEMTQGQWLRVTYENPAFFPAGKHFEGVLHTLRHPIDFVNWWTADRVMGQLGLDLPTEAQWEYAARGGTSSPWSTGDRSGSLEGAANVADIAYFDAVAGPYLAPLPWRDAYVYTSPVGSFAANAFGLHDVHGNINEWCRDSYGAYDVATRDSDGLRLATSEFKVLRGGSYSVQGECRVARRIDLRPHKQQDAGLRPVRAVERGP